MLRRLYRRAVRCFHGCLNRICDGMDIVIKILGPLFILLAFSLFGFVAYTFFTVVVPAMLAEDQPIILVGGLASTGIFLLVNLVYNYAMAICLDAGLPPEFDSAMAAAAANGKGCDAELGEEPVAPRQCTRCCRLKPPRAHHCSVCKRCVLKMDHHCPWINNCVGFNNYRYFCLFLLYLASCCWFVVMVFLEHFIDAIFHPRRSRLRFVDRQCISLSWIIAFCIFIALCLLGGFHVYLVITNQTTIEFHSNSVSKDKAKRKGELWRNPYDLGRRRNFQEVFGPNDFCRGLWLVPYIAKRPLGDGLTFASMSELKA